MRSESDFQDNYNPKNKGIFVSGLEEIVIYDGDCGICNALRVKITTRDPYNRLRFIPYQSPDWLTLIPEPGLEQVQQAVYFRSSGGEIFSGAAAIFQIMQRVPGCWRIWGQILAFPVGVFFAEPIYRLIANHRARISRWLGLASCRVDDDDTRN